MAAEAALRVRSAVYDGVWRDPTVTDDAYSRRHRGLQLVLLAHIVVIAAHGVASGVMHTVLELVPLVVLLAISRSRLGIRLRATAVALGLYACSAILVHLSFGAIEAHFHFFLVLALVSLYRDALPYLVGVLFVVFEHFVVGQVTPEAVFGHAGDPLAWAIVHTSFVAATSITHMISWRTVEQAHRGERDYLAAELERLAAVVDNAGIAIFSEDLDGTVRSWNDAATSLFGYTADEAVGQSAARLLPASRCDELSENLACVRRGHSRTYDTVRVDRAGVEVDVALVISPVREANVVVGASVMARDISERKAAERQRSAHQRDLSRHAEEMSRLAYRDPLTGLANRALFLDRLDQAHARMLREHTRLAVLMIDLDGFKLVNDTAGHAAGDELLTQVAPRVAGCLRADDTVARLGGDEFAIILEGDDVEPSAVAERVLHALARPYDITGRFFTTTASIGISLVDRRTGPVEAVRRADVALYASKGAGKNRVMVYDVAMSRDVLRRSDLERHLRQAMSDGKLALAYQAVVHPQTGQLDGFEALLRWHHPSEGFVSPTEFIPIAEETGLIVDMGTWVLKEAAAQAVRLSEIAGRPVSVAVNVSVRQLEDPDFATIVADALSSAALPAAQLVVEVTESALADSDKAVVGALGAVRDLGVRVAIDDFGTGYSSLDRLRKLPLDQLKIDRSFISEIDESAVTGTPEGHAPVLAAIVAMAAALGLRVVAEGVETVPQLQALRRMGCDLAQGFLFHRPASADEVQELVKRAAPFTAHLQQETIVPDLHLLGLMHSVQAAAASGTYDEQAMSQLLTAVCAGTGLQTAFFTAVDAREGVQRILYAHNEGAPLVEAGVTVPWERTVCRSALATGQWETNQADVDFPHSAAGEFGVRSYCGVPLFADDGEMIATLCAVDRTGRGADAGAQQFLTQLSRVFNSSGSVPGGERFVVMGGDDVKETASALGA